MPKKVLRTTLRAVAYGATFVLMLAWVFSGWPQIYDFPPGVRVAHATAPLPAYRASGTFTSGISAITPPYPASMQAGDVCLLVVTTENQAITLTSAQGFAEVPTWSPQSAGTAATDPASRLAVFWKRTVGGDTAPTVGDSGNNQEGIIHCFSGVFNTGNPWDTGAGGNDSAANDTTGTIPGSTTTTNNDLVVLIESTSNNATASTNCSGWANANLANITERQDNSNTAGLGGGSCMATGEKAATGSYTTTTVTMSATTFKGAISLALKPPQPATVTTQAASSVTDTTATLNGNITDTGGGTPTVRGFAWGTNSALSGGNTATTTESGSFGTGAFTANVSGLTCGGATYYARAYTTTSAGDALGSIQSFTTSACTVISITLTTSGNVAYGTLATGVSSSTVPAYTQTVQNNGTASETFSIAGQNTACPWVLGATAGTEQYVHEFSTNGGSSWTPLTTSNQTLASGVAVNGTQNFDLRITVPTSTSCFTQQSADVTIVAS